MPSTASPPLRLESRPYRRTFVVPQASARGVWYEREGLILRLEDASGRVGYGEVAPLPEFGSETVQAARQWLRAVPQECHRIPAVPEALPCCRFALGSALWMLDEPEVPYAFDVAALLPAGEQARAALDRAQDAGFRVFKLKVGLEDDQRELGRVHALAESLPAGGRLRLDANGALTGERLDLWIEGLRGVPQIEWLEQALPVGREDDLCARAATAPVPLALDESLSQPGGLDRAFLRGWPQPWVLKLPLLGDPRQALPPHEPADLVPSSVFETGVGVHNALRWAARLPVRLGIGYGTLQAFDDGLTLHRHGPRLDSAGLGPEAFERLWDALREHSAAS